MIDCRVLGEAFDPDRELAEFRKGCSTSGAIVTFLGQVRDLTAKGESVEALELEHYAPMTLPAIEAQTQQAADRWALDAVLVVHRAGRMVPGEAIVLVATAASHRRGAFEACDFLMDYLKSGAPFWKSQHTESGKSWIVPTAADHVSARRWQPD